MVVVTFISLIVSFFTTYFLTPHFIIFFKSIGISTYDVHKKKQKLVSSSGGISVLTGIIGGLFTYIALQTFFYNSKVGFVELFSAISSIMLISFSGFLDDLNSKPHSYEGFSYKTGLKQWQKPLFTLPAVIPLMVINAGHSLMSVPFLGTINFGIIYPLVIIPIAIIGCANMVNLLGGFNGLETSMGIVYTFSLGLYSLFIGANISAIILLTTTFSLIAFLFFNFVPAKILPGDSLTYLLGGIVAVCTILANMEKFALLTMSLFIIEGILKSKSMIKLGKFATSLGKLNKRNNKIYSKYNEMYSLTHFAMGKEGAKEKNIVFRLTLLQIIVSIIPWIIWSGIF